MEDIFGKLHSVDIVDCFDNVSLSRELTSNRRKLPIWNLTGWSSLCCNDMIDVVVVVDDGQVSLMSFNNCEIRIAVNSIIKNK